MSFVFLTTLTIDKSAAEAGNRHLLSEAGVPEGGAACQQPDHFRGEP